MEEQKIEKPNPIGVPNQQETNKQAMSQFMFLVFIPNPMLHSIHVWIDDGSIETYYSTDEFINLISKVCEYKEVNKINLACSEYGIPFSYDREKKELKQLRELPQFEKLDMDYNIYLKEQDHSKDMSLDSIYNRVKNYTPSYGLPNFTHDWAKR